MAKEKEVNKAAEVETPTAENTPTPSAREQFMNDWSAANGDVDMNDEDAVYGRMRENWEANKARKDREDRFNEIMAQNNYAPEVMDAIMDGVGPEAKVKNLIRLLAGDHKEEFRAAIEGDEEALAWLSDTRANEIVDEAKQKNEEAAKQGEIAEKVKAEDEALSAAIAEAGKKESDYEDYFNAIYNKDNGLLTRALSYDLTKEDFALLLKVADYDKNISAAEEEGYRRGKNEKVDIYADLDREGGKRPTNLGSGGNTVREKEQKNPTLAALDNMRRAY